MFPIINGSEHFESERPDIYNIASISYLWGETSTIASTIDYCSDLVQKVKLPSSCDFEHGACGYTAPKRGFSWLIRRGKYGYGSSGISYGHNGSGK